MKTTLALVVACLATVPSFAQTKWDLPTGYATGSFQTENVQAFANDVDKATAGKLKITLHANGSLYKANEIKRAVQTGQTQAGEFILDDARELFIKDGEVEVVFPAQGECVACVFGAGQVVAL